MNADERRVALDAFAGKAGAPSGDTSFLHELSQLSSPRLRFQLGTSARGYAIRKQIVRTEERLAQRLPWAHLRRAALCTARSTRVTRPSSADALLSHLNCPRAHFGERVVWSSQGISSPGYYTNASGRVTVEDVIALYKRLGPRADRLVIWGEAGAKRLVRECPELESRTFVVPPPICDRYVGVPEPHESLRLLFVGADWKRKGLTDLLNAYEQLRSGGAAVELDVVSAHGCPAADAQGVRFHGPCYRERVLDMMSKADVLVLPSEAESYGLVIAEAMMMGLAIVVSDAEPLAEIAGDAALTARFGEGDDLAGRLAALVADATLVTRLRRNARNRFLLEHHPDVFVDRLVACLDDDR